MMIVLVTEVAQIYRIWMNISLIFYKDHFISTSQFGNVIGMRVSRREFLKLLGSSAAAAAFALSTFGPCSIFNTSKCKIIIIGND
jgi:hypothetical protein